MFEHPAERSRLAGCALALALPLVLFGRRRRRARPREWAGTETMGDDGVLQIINPRRADVR